MFQNHCEVWRTNIGRRRISQQQSSNEHVSTSQNFVMYGPTKSDRPIREETQAMSELEGESIIRSNVMLNDNKKVRVGGIDSKDERLS